MGQFVRMRTFPTAAYRDVPGANTDTLYTMVWLDVSKEPWVLSIPDMGDRYYMMPMLLHDAYAGWLDECFPIARYSHDGKQSAEVRDHRAGLVRLSSQRRH